ncbi:hypothetical protein [Megamonas hypermegale]|uniref:hypothetical protein n=1 Tax=Megamonas hypermegale TaxID=158847 RepID=UPI0026F2EBE8|nr:hypothetical protein [Megamonas hypermegale]
MPYADEQASAPPNNTETGAAFRADVDRLECFTGVIICTRQRKRLRTAFTRSLLPCSGSNSPISAGIMYNLAELHQLHADE